MSRNEVYPTTAGKITISVDSNGIFTPPSCTVGPNDEVVLRSTGSGVPAQVYTFQNGQQIQAFTSGAAPYPAPVAGATYSLAIAKCSITLSVDSSPAAADQNVVVRFQGKNGTINVG